MTSRCEQIRQYLKEQGEPRSASQIAAGIGMPGDVRVSHTLGVMSREGTISKTGEGKKLVYGFVRDVITRVGAEQAAINKAAYEARRNAERKARRAALRAKSSPFELRPLLHPTAAKRPVVKPKREPPARKAIQLAVNTVKARSVAVALEKKEAAAVPVRQRAETIDEFIARGGEVQVLHPWDTSRPLRFLDERFIELD